MITKFKCHFCHKDFETESEECQDEWAKKLAIMIGFCESCKAFLSKVTRLSDEAVRKANIIRNARIVRHKELKTIESHGAEIFRNLAMNYIVECDQFYGIKHDPRMGGSASNLVSNQIMNHPEKCSHIFSGILADYQRRMLKDDPQTNP